MWCLPFFSTLYSYCIVQQKRVLLQKKSVNFPIIIAKNVIYQAFSKKKSSHFGHPLIKLYKFYFIYFETLNLTLSARKCLEVKSKNKSLSIFVTLIFYSLKSFHHSIAIQMHQSGLFHYALEQLQYPCYQYESH